MPIKFLRKKVGWYAALISTFAVSLATTTTVLSAVYFVFVRDLPYRDPRSLVRVAKLFPQGTSEKTSYAELLDWRARSATFDALAAIRWEDATLLYGSTPQRVTGGVVTSNLFPMLGVHPLLGRLFTASDEVPGTNVALITETTWHRTFGSRPDIVGKYVRLASGKATAEYQIVGVTPSSVHFFEAPAYVSPQEGIFVAQHSTLAPGEIDPGQVYVVFGRLKPGVPIRAARDDVTRLIETAPSKFPSPGAYVVSMHEAELGNNKRVLLLLALTVVLVMLIACVNIAGLLLALGSARRQEFAVRTAIGATRGHLIRQLVSEHAAIVSAGTAVGAWLTTLGLRAVTLVSPPQLPRIDDVRVSWPVFAVGCGLVALTAILSGLLPVLLLSRGESATMMKGTARSSSSRHARWRDVLVAVQLGLVFAVTLTATLAVRSFWLVEHVNLGYDPHDVVAARVLLGPRWDVAGRPQVFQRQLLERLRSTTGFEDAALSDELPPDSRVGAIFLRDGRIARPLRNDVTGGYFQVLGIPVLAGQSVGHEAGPAPVVVNEAFALTFLTGSPALGRAISMDGQTIAGVVGDTWHAKQLSSAFEPAVYGDLLDTSTGGLTRFWALVRSTSPQSLVVARIRDAVSAIDPEVPLEFTTLDTEVARARVQPRFLAMLLGAFGGFGLLVAAIGVFMGVHQSVTERLRELAIRLALGAQPRAIRYLVVRRILLVASLAIVAGGWTGLIGASGLRSVLFGLTPNDLPTLFFSAAIVVAVTIAAAWRPLERATSVDPIALLHEE